MSEYIIDAEEVINAIQEELEYETVRKDKYREIAIGMMDLQVENAVLDYAENKGKDLPSTKIMVAGKPGVVN